MAEVKRYRNIGNAPHYHQNPEWLGKGESGETPSHVKIEKGEIVESTVDLAAKFVNKFELVTDSAPTHAASPARKASVSQLVNSGVWQESDRAFLEGLSDTHYDRIAGGKAPKSTQDESGPKRIAPPGTDASGAARPKATSNLGDDVTDSFQKAHDEGFLVFATKSGKHQVVRRGEEGGKPLNPKPLEADGVDKFVEQYMKEAK